MVLFSLDSVASYARMHVTSEAKCNIDFFFFPKLPRFGVFVFRRSRVTANHVVIGTLMHDQSGSAAGVQNDMARAFIACYDVSLAISIESCVFAHDCNCVYVPYSGWSDLVQQ